MGRMDEAVVADVDADVAGPVEEDEVAGLHLPAADAASADEVGEARVVETHAEVPVDVPDEAGAVEAGAGRGSAVLVADAQQMPGVGDDPLAERQMEAVRQLVRRRRRPA